MERKLLILLILFWPWFTYAQNQKAIDSVLRMLPEAEPVEQAYLNSELAWQYLHYEKDTSYYYAQKALTLAENIGTDSVLSEAYNTMAAVVFRRGELQSSVRFGEQALVIYTALKNDRRIASSHSKIGIAYLKMGQYEKSLQHQLLALEYFHEVNDIYGQIGTYNNLCQVYRNKNNFEKAIEYARLGLDASRTVDYPYAEGGLLMDLSTYFESTKQLDSAIYYNQQALEIFRQLGYAADIITCTSNIGRLFSGRGNSKKALKYHFRAYDMALETEDNNNLSLYAEQIAKEYLKLEKPVQAKKYLDLSSRYLERVYNLHHEERLLKNYSWYYSLLGENKKALDYRIRYEVLHDSIFNLSSDTRMHEMEAKYEHSLQRQTIAEQQEIIANEQAEKALQKLENQKTRFWWIATLAGLAVISIVSFLVFRYQSMKRQNKLQYQLYNVRENIARDFHDDLGNNLARISVLSKMAYGYNDISDQVKSTIGQISQDADQLYRSTKDFIWSLKSNSNQLEELAMYLGDFAREFYADMAIRFEVKKTFSKKAQLPDYWNRQLILVFKEAITNAARHAEATEVLLSFNLNRQLLIIKLKDNGHGFNQGALHRENGLTNMQKRAEEIGGELLVSSNQKGTIITFKGRTTPNG